jgi:OmpA-OmpF porin, OOP family
MNRTSTLRLNALIGLSACAAACSSAWAQDQPYPYFGLSLGESRAKFDQTGINNRLLGPGLQTTSLSSDEKDRAYRVFGGWQFNRFVALEAAFFDLGKFSYTAVTVPTGRLDNSIKLQGGGIDVVGTLPLGERFALLGRVGAQYAKTRNSFTASGAATVANPTPSERAGNYKVGVGLQYAFSPGFVMRAEADRYRMKDGFGDQANVNVYSVSVVFPFGRAPMTSSRAPMAPAPVAYAPPPPAPAAPMVAQAPAPMAMPMQAPSPAPVAPAMRRVSFTAESLFGFDRSQLSPEGTAALDGFAREVAGTQFEVMVVQGHSDRLGSTDYNQTLSLARADAVKAYLVSSGGFAAGKITTAGLGEGSPSGKTGDCAASLPMAELRSCLQPDRRVDVDVSGMR